MINSSQNQRNPARLDIHVEIDLHAMAKFWLWVDLAQGEVSALGVVDEIFDERTGNLYALRITDFHLVKQSCTSVETTMDSVAISDLLSSLESQGQEVGRLLCWAHSHDTMAVFWSSTDNECIAGLANGGYLLSLVVNKKRETMARLDMFHPAHLCVTDVAWEHYCPLDELEAIAAEIEFHEKVAEQYPAVTEKFDFTTDQYVEQLKAAHESGIMDDDEFSEEMNWLSQEAVV